MDFTVSETWFWHVLEQVKSITSKHITEISFWYWLDKEEKPSNDLWKELDVVLTTDLFKSLNRVYVAFVHRDSNGDWYDIDSIDKSEFSSFLPGVFEKGVLTW